MSKRITEAAAEAAMTAWLDADVALGATRAEKRRETTAIEQKYSKDEKTHLEKREKAEAILVEYANENRETLLRNGGKSTKFGGGTIGWKLGSPSLKAKGDDWDNATKKIAEFAPEFVIEKIDLDKAGLLRNAENLTDILADAGLEVVQNETFYVKA